MRSGGLIVLVFVFWICAGLWAFLKTKHRSRTAVETAIYLVTYPMILALVAMNHPIALIIVVPLVMAGIPWLLAGIHLQKVLADPADERPGEFVGLPIKFWLWGLGLSVAIALLFGPR